MDLKITEIIIAFIGATPLVIGAILTYKVAVNKNRVENKSIKRELEVSGTALSSFGGVMMKFSEVEADIRALCESTPITRVIILCAWNGRYTPKWTTAVWQYRQDIKGHAAKPVSYVHVGLDDDYVSRLMRIRETGSILFNTDDAPESLIKSIYKSEGVIESLWCFLSSAVTQDKEGKLMTYMSFASQDDEIDRNTRIKCELLASKLAPLTGVVD